MKTKPEYYISLWGYDATIVDYYLVTWDGKPELSTCR